MPITLNGDGAISGLTATGISAVQNVGRANLPAGSVLQVVNATTTTQTSTTSTSFVTTNLSATITPTSTSSRILILSNGNCDAQFASAQVSITVFRGATNIGSTNGLGNIFSPAGRVISSMGINLLDSPATTSATTYTIYFASTNAAGSISYNIGNGQGAQTAVITLLEIAG